jgi:hypothetical protein
MNKREKEAYDYFFQTYVRLRDLNQPYRDNFDEYDEYYRGYRDDTDYPFAYNYSYNKMISVIYTVLGNFMSHLYRDDELVVVRPKRTADIQRAEVVAGVLNHQLHNMNCIDYQGGSYMLFLQWFLSAMVHGKGIMRAYWRKEERTLPVRREYQVPNLDFGPQGQIYIAGMDTREVMFPERQIVYDAPYLEVIPVRQFLPDPEYRSIQKMPACAHIYKKSMEWARRMEAAGEFKNVGEMGKGYKAYKDARTDGSVDVKEFMLKALEVEEAYDIDEIASNRHAANNIDFIDVYGKYALEGDVIDLDNKMTYKGRESECICTIANYDTVVRLKKVQYGAKPFFDIGAHINLHRYWDIGMVELLKDAQEAYNNISNLRVHNAMMKVNTMLKVHVDSNINPKNLVWKPFGIIPVEDMEEVQPLEVADYSSPIYQEQIQFLETIMQDMSGIYDYSKGVTPQRQEHVGTMYSIQSVAANRIKLLLMTMDYMGIRPLLKYMMMLNVYHLPSGFEYKITGNSQQAQFGRAFGSDLHVDYDFEAKYASMDPALAKEARIQQLLQYAQLWQQDPTVNHYEFKRAILELTDMSNPERFLNDPQQVQQMLQEQYMKEIMPQLGQIESQERMQGEQNRVEMAKALLDYDAKLSTSEKKAESK